YSPGSVKRRVNDTERFCRVNNLRIENQRLQPLHVRFIGFFSERRDFPLSIFRHRCEGLARNRVYFRNDPACMWLDYLRTIVKIDFVAVVVRRIMARGDDYARVRFEMANSE